MWKHQAERREGASAVSQSQVCTLSTPKPPYSTYPPFLWQQYGLSSLLCRSVFCWHKNHGTLKLVLHTTSKVLKLRLTDESLCLLTATSSTKEHELTTWWGEWAHVIQNLGTEGKTPWRKLGASVILCVHVHISPKNRLAFVAESSWCTQILEQTRNVPRDYATDWEKEYKTLGAG